MLMLTLKEGQNLNIGDYTSVHTVVHVGTISRGSVRLGVEAPKSVNVARAEIDTRKIVTKEVVWGYSTITDYWLAHYCSEPYICSLCGNSGWVDTTGVRTVAGVPAGRVNYCICPNGQAWRAAGAKVASSVRS